ncbi:sensor histidine kinase [Murimonas intestini]|uniref:sensor histidine kinase n=1 Tax=Murimonas intestini TaxID=1337051 RepID=UPI0011DE557B|nr:histidine kinase [Murimonas intestini]
MLKRVSYLKRLLIVYGGIITGVFLAFLAVYCTSQIKNTRQMTDNAMEQLASKAVSQFESILDEMSDMSLSLAANSSVKGILKDAISYDSPQNYFMYNLDAERTIQSEIIGVSGTRFSHKSFNVISGKYDEVSLTLYKSDSLNKEKVMSIGWINDMLENQVSKKIIPVGPDPYGRTDERTFSFARLIQDEFSRYGLVDIQYGDEWIRDIFQMQMQDYPVHGVVMYKDTVFYTTEDVPAGLEGQLYEYGTEKKPGQVLEEIELDGSKYTVCTSGLENYDMRIFFFIETNAYMQPIYRMTVTILVLGTSVLLLVIAVVFMISWTMNRPIRQLRDEIEHMDYKKLSLGPKINTSNNEILLLTNAFHEMLSGIKRSRDELVESRTREIKANYEVLQAQINPHFMHNILSVIGLMGYQKNAPEIMDMCSCLTRMLQYTTRTGNPVVRLGEELEHVTTYLKLMGYRYLDKLKYEVTVENGMEDIMIPKFILQPVAENCFQHSLADCTEEEYWIGIKGSYTKTGWVLKVLDNGTGFLDEAMERLEEQFGRLEEELKDGSSLPDMGIGGLALINTYARLALYSGGKIHLTVSNRDGGGSCVTFEFKGDDSND